MNKMFRKMIHRFATRYGIALTSRMDKYAHHLNERMKYIEVKRIDLNNKMDEYENMISSAIESNQRLKKLEEALGIEYVSTPEFIGYQKKA